MENEKLSKPQADLPLPEKEIPAHVASQGLTLQGYGRKFHFPKFVFLAIVFIVLLGITGGAYFLGRNSVFKELNPTNPAIPPKSPIIYQGTPTPDPTANWKVTDSENNTGWKKYTNTKLNYSFEIPKTWKHEMEYDNEAIVLQSPDLKINKNIGRAIEGSTINLESRVINETSIDKWFNDYWSQPHGGGRPENKTNTYIDTNIKALKYEFNYEGSQVETEFIKDGYLYSINIDFPYIEATKTWSERDLPIYNQMLSTFKFTN